jgi:hypothetical protein
MTDEQTVTALAPDSTDKKRVHRRTQYERLLVQLQSKQNVVTKSKQRVEARQAELEDAERELRMSEQECDLVRRMLDLAKEQQSLSLNGSGEPAP